MNLYVYLQVGRACLGRGGEVLAVACQWFGYYLSGVVAIVYTSSQWDQTFRGWAFAEDICQWEWMLITSGLLIPFVQVASFSQFAKLSILSALSTVYFVAIYLYSIFVNGPYSAGGETSYDWDSNLSLPLGQLEPGSGTASMLYGADLGNTSHGADPFLRGGGRLAGGAGSGPCYDSYTWSGMLAAVANMAYTFSGHGTYPEQIREMTRPADFGKGFTLLYAVAAPFYVACAVVGFHAFGNMASANVVENLQDVLFVRIGLYIGLVTYFPIIVLGQVVLMLSVEVPLGILPTDFLTNTSAAHLEGGRVAAALRRFPPALVRFVWRSAYVASMLLWAQALVGAGLAFYVNIAGSIGLAACTYWLPYVFALARVWRGAPVPAHKSASWADMINAGCAPSTAVTAAPRGARAVLYAFFAAGGMFISCTGVYFNLAGLVDAGDFELFQEKSCREGANFWGDYMWNASLSRNTTAYQTLIIGCCENVDTCGD